MIAVLMVLLWGWVLWFLVTRLKRSRPTLAIEAPVAVAYAIRLLAIPVITATGIGLSLRGGDEISFIRGAHMIANSSFASSAWMPFGHNGLYEIVFALQLRLARMTVDTMRITQVALAVVGLTLIIVTVHDLGGPRPARLAAWLLAVEPVSVFFSQVLHKEPFMMLATGLVVFGGKKVWDALNPAGMLIMALGGAIAVATRPYAGWALLGAAVFLTGHGAVRNIRTRGRSVFVLLGVVGVCGAMAPLILAKTSTQSLKLLQTSQTANTQSAGTAGNHLALESVNFSSRTALITHLPQRVADLLLRPWPWQIGDTSQRLGVIGTLIAYGAMGAFILYAIRCRKRLFELTGPLIYPLFFLLLAYSLSVGNAGTGFRYRSQLTVLIIAAAVLLREAWQQQTAPAQAREPRWAPGRTPQLATPSGRWRANFAPPARLRDKW